jgi:hypothetical protein
MLLAPVLARLQATTLWWYIVIATPLNTGKYILITYKDSLNPRSSAWSELCHVGV